MVLEKPIDEGIVDLRLQKAQAREQGFMPLGKLQRAFKCDDFVV
jgi:hypothetical protein